MLENIVERGIMQIKLEVGDAKKVMVNAVKTNKAGILAGVAYGIAGRIFINDPSAGILPAMLTPLVTYAEKRSWLNKFDSAGVSMGGYFVGYFVTDIVLKAVFNEFSSYIAPSQMPLQPPALPEQQLPQQPRGIWV